MSKPRATQLIQASQVVANLETVTMVTKPESERQVRPLANLPPEQQQQVWQKALEIGKGKP